MSAPTGDRSVTGRRTRKLPHQSFTRWLQLTRPGFRYALSAGVVGLAMLLRLLFPPIFADMPYLVFYPAVVGAAAWGGAGPGVLATIASALLVHLFFIEPYGRINVYDPRELAHITIFLVSGIGISAVAGRWQTARNRERRQAAEVADSRSRLAEANATLEQRVAERTAEAEQRAEQLRRLAAELSQAEHRERRRVAGVLHDHVQQLLVAARMRVAVACKAEDREAMIASLRSVDEMVTEVLAATRSLTAELSPSILQTGRFSEALAWLAAWVGQKHGLTVHVQADASIDLSEDVRALLFMAARELLFNVVKHAAVQQATLQLFRTGAQEVRLVVADEGAGFDPLQQRQDKNDVGGFGLRSMGERLKLVGGRMEVDAAPGRGTRVTLLAPQGPIRPTVPL